MIAVVGGGITGAFAAYFLARRGAEVTLIERDEVGAHASGKNPGGLNPLHGPGIPARCRSWRSRPSTCISSTSRPRLQLAVDADDVARLARSKELYDSAAGFSAAWLERKELLELEP